MTRVVCQFSCGAASAVATKLAIEKYGDVVHVVNAFVADEATVMLHERRVPGARAALVAWAALIGADIKEQPLQGGNYRLYRVDLLHGCEISVIAKVDPDAKLVGERAGELVTS